MFKHFPSTSLTFVKLAISPLTAPVEPYWTPFERLFQHVKLSFTTLTSPSGDFLPLSDIEPPH